MENFISTPVTGPEYVPPASPEALRPLSLMPHEKGGGDCWLRVVDRLDGVSTARLGASHPEFREILGRDARTLEWCRRAASLTAPQQDRLRALCRAHASEKPDDIRRAVSNLLPQDHLAFPNWRPQHRVALAGSLGQMQSSMASQLSRQPATINVESLSKLSVDIGEVSSALGRRANPSNQAELTTYVTRALNLELSEFVEKSSHTASNHHFLILRPSYIKYDFSRWQKVCLLLSEGSQDEYRSKMAKVALEVRAAMLRQLPEIGALSDTKENERARTLRDWEEATEQWWV